MRVFFLSFTSYGQGDIVTFPLKNYTLFKTIRQLECLRGSILLEGDKALLVSKHYFLSTIYHIGPHPSGFDGHTYVSFSVGPYGSITPSKLIQVRGDLASYMLAERPTWQYF